MKASARAIEARHAARNALGRGDEATALQESLRALVYGDPDPATLELFELLAVTGDPVPSAALLGDALEDAWGDWPPQSHCRLAALRFDLLRDMPAGADDRDLAEAAVRTLEAAAGGVRHEAAWDPVADPDRRAALLGAIATSHDAMAAALEHLAWAPKRAGIHADALRFAEQVAWANAAEPALVRASERLLHDLARSGGPEANAARDAARRLEAMRKQQRPSPERRPAPAPLPDLSGRCIVIVGGHDGLRAAIMRDLRDLNPGELRDIPPTWEGQRGGGVEPALRGADLAVLVIRQLDHSTGDRAEAVARELGVAVRRARSASVAAVRDAVLAWAGRG